MWSLAAVLMLLAIGLGAAAESTWVGGLAMGVVGCLVIAWIGAQARRERAFLPAALVGLILLGAASWLAHQAPASGVPYAPLAVPGLLAAFWFGGSVFCRLCAVALSEDEHPDLAIYAPEGYPGCLSALCILVALWQLGVLAQRLLG